MESSYLYIPGGSESGLMFLFPCGENRISVSSLAWSWSHSLPKGSLQTGLSTSMLYLCVLFPSLCRIQHSFQLQWLALDIASGSSRSSFESDAPGDNRVYCFMNPCISSKGKATVKALRGNRILPGGRVEISERKGCFIVWIFHS